MFNIVPDFCVSQDQWGHIWSARSSFGLPSTGGTWTYLSKNSEGPQRGSRGWGSCCVRREWELRLLSLEEEKAQGVLSTCLNAWWGWVEKTERWAHTEILLKLKRTLFLREGGQTLAQVAQRSCGVSTLGETQNLAGHSPGQPAPGDLALSGRWGQAISSGPCQPQLVCADTGKGSYLHNWFLFYSRWRRTGISGGDWWPRTPDGWAVM